MRPSEREVPRMTPEERYLLEGIERRAEACRRYAAICLKNGSTVPSVTSMIAWNLIRTFFLLVGERMLTDVLSWMFGAMRSDAMLCRICGRLKKERTAIACPACIQSMDDEDRLVDEWLLLERPASGGVS